MGGEGEGGFHIWNIWEGASFHTNGICGLWRQVKILKNHCSLLELLYKWTIELKYQNITHANYTGGLWQQVEIL